MKVGDLYALFSIQTDRRSIGAVEGALGGIRRTSSSVLGSVARLGTGVAAVFGAGKLGQSLIGFNSKVEDAKLSMASMLALAKKTGVNEQLDIAAEQYDKIRAAAAELPGSTEEYVGAMARLVYPLTKAGFSLEKIRELSANTVVAAKGIGITTVAASLRDVQQALEGRWSSTDLFLNSLLQPMGFEGEEGRAKFKKLSKEKRAETLNEALTQKAIVESAKKQAMTFTGQTDKVKESTAQVLGKVGLPLFEALSQALARANVWLTKNKDAVEAFATKVGTSLMGALTTIKDIFMWLTDHEDVVKSALWGIAGAFTFLMGRAAMAWLAVAWPVIAGAGIFAALMYVFKKTHSWLAVIATAFGMLFVVSKVYKMVGAIKALADATWGLSKASAAAAASGGAGGVAGGGVKAGGIRSVVKTLAPILGVIGVSALASEYASENLIAGDSRAERDVELAKGPARGGGLWGRMQDTQGVTDYGSPSAPAGKTTVVNITMGAPNVDITAADAAGSVAALQNYQVSLIQAAYREANRNLTGNK